VKSAIKRFAAHHRVFIAGKSKYSGEFHYEQSFPMATYAPWLSDKRFCEVFARIRSNTFVDKYRCYELWELVRQIEHLPGSVLEVGVWRGGTGCLLAANTSKPVILCDTFSGVVKASAKDSKYHGGEHSDCSRSMVEQLALGLNVNVDIREGIFPDDFPELARGAFSFVHIDVDVYQSAKEILNSVWPNMPTGGIVVFDDYGFDNCDGITKLVNEFRGRPNTLLIHNLNGHAVMVKT
jgi:O-methyltransferase